MGRLPRDRLSRRRRGVHPEPRPAAARSLLSRAARRACSRGLPDGCVVDGEIVIATPRGSTSTRCSCGCIRPRRAWRSWRRRRRPRSSRSICSPSTGSDLRDAPQHERRARLERLLASVQPPIHLTPMTRDRDVAAEWLARFEGAGLDGVIAKPDDGTYQPGKRAMIKIKHARTADCVVAGFRWHKSGQGRAGRLAAARALRRAAARLHHVGVTSSFTMATRKAARRRAGAAARRTRSTDHPWREWAEADGSETTRMPGGQSRWSAGKDLSWEPLRIERVCEVKYDHMQGDRVPPRRDVSALAARQAAERLPLRSARGHDALRAREGLRRRPSAGSLTRRPVVRRASSGSSGSCGGRIASGTCCRLTRMRVQVLKRPRIASTSTSAGSQVRGGFRMTRLPALEPRQRVVFLARAADLDQRMLRRRRPLRRRARTRGALARLLACSAAATARRRGLRVSWRADSSSSASSEPACSSIPAWRSPIAANRAGIVAQREVGRIAVVDLVPGQRRRDARVGRRPHRVGAGDGAVLRVLVVVEEHAVALFLPPLAGGERRRAPLDLARKRQRGAPHLVEASSAARCARRRGCRASRRSSASRPARSRRASRARRARPRGSAATRRPGPDRDRRAARRDDRDRRRAPDAGAARGRRGSPSTRSAAASRGTTSSAVRPDGNCSVDDLDPVGPRFGRALLEEELAADAVRDSAPARSAVRRRRAARRRRRRGNSAPDRAWCGPACGKSTLRGIRDRDLAAGRRGAMLLFGGLRHVGQISIFTFRGTSYLDCRENATMENLTPCRSGTPSDRQ